MRCKRGGSFALVLGLLLPAGAAGQVAWDSPLLMPPGVEEGFGLYLVDVEGGGLGVLGTWRSPGWNFGIRGGLAEAAGDDDLGVFGGIDVHGSLTRSTNEFPLDIDWVFGAGLGIADFARISLPLGLSVGHTFDAEDVSFTPYATPRVVLDAFLGDDRPRDDVDLELAVDIGLDVRLTQAFLIRFGGTVGDRDGVGIGIVF
jgi:hypothetical protein